MLNKLISNRNTWFNRRIQANYQRSPHHSSQQNTNDSSKPKTYLPIITLLEIGLYACTLVYVVYSIKNEKRAVEEPQKSEKPKI